MKPFVITREQVIAHGPCDTSFFDHSPRRVGNEVVYPNGFDPEPLAKDDPTALLWLVSKQLVPLSLSAARTAIEAAHGKQAHGLGTVPAPGTPPVAAPSPNMQPSTSARTTGPIGVAVRSKAGARSVQNVTTAARRTAPTPPATAKNVAVKRGR